jgi:hypothetical protein
VERQRQGHIVVQLFVHELKLLVGVVKLIFLDQPDLLLLIEFFVVITLNLSFGSCDIGNSLELVLLEDFTDGLVFGVVDYSKENRSVERHFVIGVSSTSEFLVDIVTLSTSRFDCENSHNIVWSRVLHYHLVVLLRSKMNDAIFRLGEEVLHFG